MALSPSEARELYESELERIERILAFTARRNGLSDDEREEFRSEAHLHLLDDDFRAVAAYDGEASFATYLVVVLQRFLLDFRTARWGRWRPSATARNAGEVGVRLETLVVRDGRDFQEAVEILRRNHGVTTSRDELYALLQSFPHRYGKASVRHTSLDAEGAPEPAQAPEPPTRGSPEAALHDALESELADLDPEDRLLLRLVYRDGHAVSTISRRLGWNQRSLYTRLERLRGRLRRALESRGLTWDALRPLVGAGAPGPGFDLHEILAPRPSTESGADAREGGPR